MTEEEKGVQERAQIYLTSFMNVPYRETLTRCTRSGYMPWVVRGGGGVPSVRVMGILCYSGDLNSKHLNSGNI